MDEPVTGLCFADDPKPPGPVELEENVPGTVTVIWEPSPDEKRDDRLHYTVSKLDSTKRNWTTVAENLFNNKCTVCNIMPGREYHFRVYAENDMGVSAPSESPTCWKEKKKGIRLRPQIVSSSGMLNLFLIPCRKMCGERTDQKGLRLAMRSDLHRPVEVSRCTQGLRVLHELRGEGKPQTSHHVVPQSHQPQH